MTWESYPFSFRYHFCELSLNYGVKSVQMNIYCNLYYTLLISICSIVLTSFDCKIPKFSQRYTYLLSQTRMFSSSPTEVVSGRAILFAPCPVNDSPSKMHEVPKQSSFDNYTRTKILGTLVLTQNVKPLNCKKK